MCNAAGSDTALPPAPAPLPPLGSFMASAHQLLRPVDGDDAGGHALQLSKVYAPCPRTCRRPRAFSFPANKRQAG